MALQCMELAILSPTVARTLQTAAYVGLECTQMRELTNSERAAQHDILHQPYAQDHNVELKLDAMNSNLSRQVFCRQAAYGSLHFMTHCTPHGSLTLVKPVKKRTSSSLEKRGTPLRASKTMRLGHGWWPRRLGLMQVAAGPARALWPEAQAGCRDEIQTQGRVSE